MILYNKRIKTVLIRLRLCTGWSAHLMFANHQRQASSQQGPYCFVLNDVLKFVIPAFFFRKKYVNFVPKLVCRPSVRVCLCACVRHIVDMMQKALDNVSCDLDQIL